MVGKYFAKTDIVEIYFGYSAFFGLLNGNIVGHFGAKVIHMNHQSDKIAMHVDNPLELQLLYSKKLFLDENESFGAENPISEVAEIRLEDQKEMSLPIAFFLDVAGAQQSGINDLGLLLGRMLMVTLLDDKIPTIEMAEILDLKLFSEEDFNKKLIGHRKSVVFADNWPFQSISNQAVMSVLVLNEKNVFWAPSIPVIMNNPEIKKDFAARLKHYFNIP